MAEVLQCDSCNATSKTRYPGGWNRLWPHEDTGTIEQQLTFCSDQCTLNYITAKMLIKQAGEGTTTI